MKTIVIIAVFFLCGIESKAQDSLVIVHLNNTNWNCNTPTGEFAIQRGNWITYDFSHDGKYRTVSKEEAFEIWRKEHTNHFTGININGKK